MKKIYIIGIGGIGISAIARYYNDNGYKVYGSDKFYSTLIETLVGEGIDIYIGERPEIIDHSFEKIIYTEAISHSHKEYIKGKELFIPLYSYPEAIGEITQEKKLIAISGTHGKSTTTSMTSILLKNSNYNFTTIVGTLLREFNNKNYYNKQKTQNTNDYFILEACEYKRSFLHYSPYILAITNIELDHLDYYKNIDDYISAFSSLIDRVKKGGFVIINGQEENSRHFLYKRQNINYIQIFDNYFLHQGQKIVFPNIDIEFIGEHILYDAKIVYIIGYIIGLGKEIILEGLQKYKGAWRRMEKVGYTKNNNLLISDYGHHPTEIQKTLHMIKNTYPGKKIITIFQPHQYSRTLELLDDFRISFSDSDIVIIPNIYESRDTEEDKTKINAEKFTWLLNHEWKICGEGMENTRIYINKFDEKYKEKAVFVILGAGDVDNLRYQIQLKKTKF